MEANTQLKNAFFSAANIDYLQTQMESRFRMESGMSISRQNDKELEVIMGTAWAHNAQGVAVSTREMSVLNEIVLDETLNQIRTGVAHHLNWHRLRDQPQLITPGVPGKSWNPLVMGDKIF